MKLSNTFRPAPGLYVSNLEYHVRGPYSGCITAYTTFAGRYVRETVFRVRGFRNGRGMCLVRIDQSHLHPAARQHWRAVEQGFIGVCHICGLGPKAHSAVNSNEILPEEEFTS